MTVHLSPAFRNEQVDAQPTQVDDAVDGISGDDFDLTVGDPPEVQAVTMRRPTVRRLVLVPQVGDDTPQSIQDRFSQSSVNAELSEEAPEPHSVPLVEAPSDAEGAPLSSENDAESLGGRNWSRQNQNQSEKPTTPESLQPSRKVSRIWIMLIWSICFR